MVGPNAASLDVLLGNYFGVSETMTTFLEGLVDAAPEGLKLEYWSGCMLAQPRQNPQNCGTEFSKLWNRFSKITEQFSKLWETVSAINLT